MVKIKIFLIFIVPFLFISGCAETIVYKRPAVPPPRVEVVTVIPYPRAVWVPGHWVWKSRIAAYRWVPGHWRRNF